MLTPKKTCREILFGRNRRGWNEYIAMHCKTRVYINRNLDCFAKSVFTILWYKSISRENCITELLKLPDRLTVKEIDGFYHWHRNYDLVLLRGVYQIYSFYKKMQLRKWFNMTVRSSKFELIRSVLTSSGHQRCHKITHRIKSAIELPVLNWMNGEGNSLIVKRQVVSVKYVDFYHTSLSS